MSKYTVDESVETVDWIPCVGQMVVNSEGEKFIIKGFRCFEQGYATVELHNLEIGTVIARLDEIKPYVVKVKR